MPDRVPMPEADMLPKGHVRDRLVQQYGEATVTRAEIMAVMDVMIMHGIIRPEEMAELIKKKCERAEQRRMQQAGFDA